MARLTIGDGVSPITTVTGVPITQLVFDFSSLQTVAMDVEPEMDATGQDLLCVKVSLEVMGAVSRTTVASNKNRALPPGPEGTGDDLGWTAAIIRDLLMIPRNRVRFEIGGQTVLLTPGQNAKTGAFFKTDVKGGPFPQRASYTQFVGEKLAILHYRLISYVWYGFKSSALLSLRWRMEARVDEHAYTTRTTRGVAVFRKDFMEALIPAPPLAPPAVPDDFRKLMVLPCTDGMRRQSVDVIQNEEGTTLEFTVTDVETTYGTGARSDVVVVRGSATVGVDSPIKDLKGGIGGAFDFASRAIRGDIPGAIGRIWTSAVPVNRNVAVFRATGTKKSDRKNLVLAAVHVCLDRLKPVYAGPRGGAIVSMYISVNCDSEDAPFAEAKVELLGFNSASLLSLITSDPTKLLNYDTTITGARAGVAGFPWGPGVDSVQLPGTSGNTRGTWLWRLVCQTLRNPQSAYDLPDSPPPPITAVDARKLS